MTTITKKQRKTYGPREFTEGGRRYKIKATVRHDDECGNGHNTFAITADGWELDERGNWRESFGGCCHDEIAKVFPKLAPFIKWHLCSADGPMYYIANTLYHVRGVDYDGLKAGEHSAYTSKITANVKTDGASTVLYGSETMYSNHQNNPNLAKINKTEQGKLDAFLALVKPELDPQLMQEPCTWSESKGQPVDIEAARRSAIWPDATLEQLRSEIALKQRLPGLLKDFQRDVESLGLQF